MLALALEIKDNNFMIERIGIVGGGQLGRMLTEAALPLGFQVTVVDGADGCPAAQVGADQIKASLSDLDAIDQLVEGSDVTTWEIEHIPAQHLLDLEAQGANIEPSPNTLLTIQDKLLQKQFLQNAGIPVAPFSGELNEDVFPGGGPFVVKARKGGYDGRGNLVVDTLEDDRINEQFGDTPTYVEQAIGFNKELSVVAARDKAGDVECYPAVETIHKDNICHTVISPAEIGDEASEEARRVATQVMSKLEGAGVFAIEMFLVDGDVLVNEIAPRVHNSGHQTIEANVTSQFEQHIRAITAMPLGVVATRSTVSGMINILGTREEPLSREGLDRVLALPDVHPHFYGKSSRPQRKIGHITFLGDSHDRVRNVLNKAREELEV